MKYGAGSPFCFKTVKLRSSSSDRIFTRGVCARAQVETRANRAINERTTLSAYQGWKRRIEAHLGTVGGGNRKRRGRQSAAYHGAELDTEVLVLYVSGSGRLPVALLFAGVRVTHEQFEGSARRPSMEPIFLLAVKRRYREIGGETHCRAALCLNNLEPRPNHRPPAVNAQGVLRCPAWGSSK